MIHRKGKKEVVRGRRGKRIEGIHKREERGSKEKRGAKEKGGRIREEGREERDRRVYYAHESIRP